jgi:hypothetical protein
MLELTTSFDVFPWTLTVYPDSCDCIRPLGAWMLRTGQGWTGMTGSILYVQTLAYVIYRAKNLVACASAGPWQQNTKGKMTMSAIRSYGKY